MLSRQGAEKAPALAHHWGSAAVKSFTPKPKKSPQVEASSSRCSARGFLPCLVLNTGSPAPKKTRRRLSVLSLQQVVAFSRNPSSKQVLCQINMCETPFVSFPAFLCVREGVGLGLVF